MLGNLFSNHVALALVQSILTWTTNGTVQTITNKDSIYGTNLVFNIAADLPVIDSHGNSVTTISQSGMYSYQYQNWYYQQFITLPTGTQTALVSYVPGSLAFETVTNTQAHMNALSFTAACNMFTTQNWSTTNFVRNANFWLQGCPELTAIVIGEGATSLGGSGSIGGSAISPRHVINCAHAPFTSGLVLTWVDDNGAPIQRTVIDSTNYSIGVNDINIGLLNADLPATIHPFTLLPTNAAAVLPTLTNGVQLQVLGYNQGQQLFPKLWTGYQTSSVNYFSSSPQWVGTAWNYTVVGGDSGHPVMMLIGTNLILLSHWTYAYGGYSYFNFIPTINFAMHFLSTKNSLSSDYQVTTNGLTGWPRY